MPSKPSIPNFILRRKSFWLSLFTIIFLTWAWHDSERNIRSIDYNNGKYFCSIGSQEGGILLGFHDGFVYAPIGLHVTHIEKYPTYRKRLIFYLEPDIHYSTLMLLVMAATTAWLTWRWRKTVAALSKCHA